MPPATRIYNSFVTDSRRWQHYEPRAGDVVVATPPKSGTTWMQTIVALLISGDPAVEPQIAKNMPWFDSRMTPLEDRLAILAAQPGRRSVKTHTPLDGIAYYPECTYLTVYRHPLDVHFSMRNHAVNMPGGMLDWYFPDESDLTFTRFLSGADEGADFEPASLASIIHHYRTFAAARDRPNIHIFHYADLKRDLTGQMRRIAEFLGISHDDDTFAALVQAATFENMQANASRYAPAGGEDFWKSDRDFFKSASSRKWEGKLSDAQIAAYNAMMREHLSAEDIRWLEEGSG